MVWWLSYSFRKDCIQHACPKPQLWGFDGLLGFLAKLVPNYYYYFKIAHYSVVWITYNFVAWQCQERGQLVYFLFYLWPDLGNSSKIWHSYILQPVQLKFKYFSIDFPWKYILSNLEQQLPGFHLLNLLILFYIVCLKTYFFSNAHSCSASFVF